MEAALGFLAVIVIVALIFGLPHLLSQGDTMWCSRDFRNLERNRKGREAQALSHNKE